MAIFIRAAPFSIFRFTSAPVDRCKGMCTQASVSSLLILGLYLSLVLAGYEQSEFPQGAAHPMQLIQSMFQYVRNLFDAD